MRKERKDENSMFGKNAFTRFQSQAVEDSAVSQKVHQKLARRGAKNWIEKLLCFHGKTTREVGGRSPGVCNSQLNTGPSVIFQQLLKRLPHWIKLVIKQRVKRRRRRRMGRWKNVAICFSPLKGAVLSICVLDGPIDELIRHSFAAIIKARMEVQQLSVMLHLLNASSPPRTIGSDTQTLPPPPRPRFSKPHQAQIRHLFKLWPTYTGPCQRAVCAN